LIQILQAAPTALRITTGSPSASRARGGAAPRQRGGAAALGVD